MKRLAALVLIVAAVQCTPTSNTVVGIGGTTGGGITPTDVNVNDNIFTPPAVTVTRNGQVRWTWRGQQAIQHSVTFDDGSQSQNPKSQGNFTRRFTTSGVFTYYCTVHGRDVMSGVVTVNDPVSP